MNDFIKEKIKSIQTRRENLIAELNALAGAEQAYNEMLTELEKGVNNEPDKDKNG